MRSDLGLMVTRNYYLIHWYLCLRLSFLGVVLIRHLGAFTLWSWSSLATSALSTGVSSQLWRGACIWLLSFIFILLIWKELGQNLVCWACICFKIVYSINICDISVFIRLNRSVISGVIEYITTIVIEVVTGVHIWRLFLHLVPFLTQITTLSTVLLLCSCRNFWELLLLIIIFLFNWFVSNHGWNLFLLNHCSRNYWYLLLMIRICHESILITWR